MNDEKVCLTKEQRKLLDRVSREEAFPEIGALPPVPKARLPGLTWRPFANVRPPEPDLLMVGDD